MQRRVPEDIRPDTSGFDRLFLSHTEKQAIQKARSLPHERGSDLLPLLASELAAVRTEMESLRKETARLIPARFSTSERTRHSHVQERLQDLCLRIRGLERALAGESGSEPITRLPLSTWIDKVLHLLSLEMGSIGVSVKTACPNPLEVRIHETSAVRGLFEFLRGLFSIPDRKALSLEFHAETLSGAPFLQIFFQHQGDTLRAEDLRLGSLLSLQLRDGAEVDYEAAGDRLCIRIAFPRMEEQVAETPVRVPC